jgi:hypothetical protein
MKTTNCKSSLVFIACMFFLQTGFGQSSGKVVINEYMPWTSNGCGTTSEFVELLNFGPGPVDIGCYILTTGTYSITIPPNTVLQPGDFYVLAGQDFLPDDCANIDSMGKGVTPDLNWNSCRCTNIPVPTTGNGLISDGGTSNTPLVLMDPQLTIIDAVVRGLPAEPSTLISASTVGGRCDRKSFDLGIMPVLYEVLGMSAGRGNSFARTIDGDCGWVKDPKQSANASNNRNGDVTDIYYSFSLINPMDCDNLGGRVSIYVEHVDYASIFPMNYTFAIDKNDNGIFDEMDDYSFFLDSTPPSIEVSGLPTGHYKITIASVKGCYLKSFEFKILECSASLPVKLEYFTSSSRKKGTHLLQWKISETEKLEKMIVQKAKRNGAFTDDKTIPVTAGTTGTNPFSSEVTGDDYSLFRLKLVTRDGNVFYSSVISTAFTEVVNKTWPNPASNELNLELTSAVSKISTYTFYNSSGNIAGKGQLTLKKGSGLYNLPISQLPAGIYQLQIADAGPGQQPISIRFVKH